MKHYPVMLPEVLAAISPGAGDICVDGTFGNGGYSEALLGEAECRVIGLDRDPSVRPRADELLSAFPDRFQFIETPFSKMATAGLPDQVDAVVLDIGVSSMQIDQAERGFSFMKSGPLDMRMGQDGPTAADAVNHLPEARLARLFTVYGEERQARRIAGAIVRARSEAPIATTDGLAELIENTIGRRGKIHPATRVFQALRIYINDELGELYAGLCAAESLLSPGGRLVIVSFHSLEDRIVKRFLQRRTGIQSGGSRHAPEVKGEGLSASFELPRRSVVKPSKRELEENVRSRSAKLRVGVRTSAPYYPANDNVLPDVPGLEELEALL